METKKDINKLVIDNYLRLKPSVFFLPAFLLITIVLFLYNQDSLSTDGYIRIQKESFFFINYYLGQYPNLQFNLTQLGDDLIFLSLLSVLIIYAPKIWESLISSLLLSLVSSCLLKKIFAVPRPAAVFDHSSFIIVGNTLSGHTSLPSGHSITIFAILTILLFAFMPSKTRYGFLWSFFIILTGLFFVFTRVGVGAHYPLDVIIGAIIGYILGCTGIFISRKYKVWSWINDKRYYPVFILLFLICGISLINRIMIENLTIYYLSIASLTISLYKTITIYVKK